VLSLSHVESPSLPVEGKEQAEDGGETLGIATSTVLVALFAKNEGRHEHVTAPGQETVDER
jgi:hypothetical protein